MMHRHTCSIICHWYTLITLDDSLRPQRPWLAALRYFTLFIRVRDIPAPTNEVQDCTLETSCFLPFGIVSGVCVTSINILNFTVVGDGDFMISRADLRETVVVYGYIGRRPKAWARAEADSGDIFPPARDFALLE